jgi:hypothetical protein
MTPDQAALLKRGDLVTHASWHGETQTVSAVDSLTFPQDPVVFFRNGGFWRSSRLTVVKETT